MFVYLKVWVQEHKKKKERSTCKTFPKEGRSRSWTGLHRKLMIQMHSYGGKKWERPSDEWGDNWEEGKEETMLTAVSQMRPPDLHWKLLKSSFSDEWLMKYLLDQFTKSAKFTVFSWYKICFKSYTNTDPTMDAIKKKMQAMKIEKDNAMDRADQCEQAAKAAKVN